jgi:hypothetical protein
MLRGREAPGLGDRCPPWRPAQGVATTEAGNEKNGTVAGAIRTHG